MSHKPLHKRWDFIAAFVVPALIAAGIALSIYIAEPFRSFCFTSECYGFALNVFQIPLTVLAASLPLAGIVAAYHRSIETQTQIELTINNNTFSNYIKHKEEFGKVFTSIEDGRHGQGEYIFGNTNRIYREFFPENDYTKLVLIADQKGVEDFFRKVEQQIERCKSVLHTKEPTEQEIFDYYKSIKTCLGYFRVMNPVQVCMSLKFQGESIHLPNSLNPTVSLFAGMTMIASRLQFYLGNDVSYAAGKGIQVETIIAIQSFNKKYFVKPD